MASTVDHRRNFNHLTRVPTMKARYDNEGLPPLRTGDIEYKDVSGHAVIADLGMLLIRKAWEDRCEMEDLADGFGVGSGTHGDWSAIRDSSQEAKDAMLERALNHHFPVRSRVIEHEQLCKDVQDAVPDLLASEQGTSCLVGTFRQTDNSALADRLMERYKLQVRERTGA